MKILIGVVSCHSYQYAADDSVGHKTGSDPVRASASRKTWVKNFPHDKLDLKFFYGRGGDRQPAADEVFLDAPDGYYELPAKVKAMFRWALDAGYDYCLKIDDDVLLRPTNLLKFFQPVDYCGYELEAAIGKYASGAAYVISRRAMQLVVDTPWDDTFNRAEDQWTGEVLKRNGIHLLHDHRYLCCHCDSCFKKFGLDNLITIHTRSPQQMYDLHAKLGQ